MEKQDQTMFQGAVSARETKPEPDGEPHRRPAPLARQRRCGPRDGYRRLALAFAAIIGCSVIAGTVEADLASYASGPVKLDQQPASDVEIGDAVTFTAHLEAPAPPDPKYRFEVIPLFGAGRRVILENDDAASFVWRPIAEGYYLVRATVRSPGEPDAFSIAAVWVRGPAEDVAVLPTRHPLVALYAARVELSNGIFPDGGSLPGIDFSWPTPGPCADLASTCGLRVRARALRGGPEVETPVVSIERSTATSVLVAGLGPETTYRLAHEIVDATGDVIERGPERLFTTGPLPEAMPPATPLPATGPATTGNPILVAAHIPTSPAGIGAVGYDASGAIVWFARSATEERQVQTVLPGGRFLNRVTPRPGEGGGVVAETDLAGSQLRRVSSRRVNEALIARGERPILGFHHDVIALPDRHLGLLAYQVDSFEDIRAPGVSTRVLGDAIVVVDEDLELVWSWSSFDQLDLTRAPGLGETCGIRVPGCPAKPEADGAEDWTHSNAIAYDPTDGNLLISIRHQDWIAKIAYADGQGGGEIVWRLGAGGDFALSAGNLLSWPTHGHDVNVLPDGRIVYFDNGNSRCVVFRDCESRGQVWSLDEQTLTASLDVEARLGVYAPAVGSAQALVGGGFAFGSGIVIGSPVTFAHEVDASGAVVKEITSPLLSYRYYRLPDLYSSPPIATAEP